MGGRAAGGRRRCVRAAGGGEGGGGRAGGGRNSPAYFLISDIQELYNKKLKPPKPSKPPQTVKSKLEGFLEKLHIDTTNAYEDGDLELRIEHYIDSDRNIEKEAAVGLVKFIRNLQVAELGQLELPEEIKKDLKKLKKLNKKLEEKLKVAEERIATEAYGANIRELQGKGFTYG